MHKNNGWTFYKIKSTLSHSSYDITSFISCSVRNFYDQTILCGYFQLLSSSDLPGSTSWLWHSKTHFGFLTSRINLYCFKPPSLGQFNLGAYENYEIYLSVHTGIFITISMFFTNKNIIFTTAPSILFYNIVILVEIDILF